MKTNGIKEKLHNHVKNFNFPRLAGSLGEKKAVNLTVETYRSIGYNKEKIIQQHFKFSTFYSEEFIKIIIIFNIASIAIIFLIKYIYPFFTFLFIGIFLIAFISMNKVFKHPELKGFWERNFGKTLSATNIFTQVTAKELSPETAGNIIISAHIDSKSQTYKTIWRVLFFRIWLYGEISLFFFYLIFILDFHVLSTTFWPIIYLFEFGIIFATILVVSSNILLLFLKIENKSPGALDNASGMALVFELSSIFRENPLNSYNLWFCQFSAEEIGTMGSRFFLDTYSEKFKKGKTFQFNFDMVSAKNEKKNFLEFIESYGIFPKKKISPTLNEIIEKSAKTLGLTVKKFHVSVGAHTDSLPFHLRKFDVIDFTTRAAAKYTHSERDTPDRVDLEILLSTYNIVQKAVLMLDNNFSY